MVIAFVLELCEFSVCGFLLLEYVLSGRRHGRADAVQARAGGHRGRVGRRCLCRALGGATYARLGREDGNLSVRGTRNTGQVFSPSWAIHYLEHLGTSIEGI